MFGRIKQRRKRKRFERLTGTDARDLGAGTIDFLTDFWTILAITELLDEL